MVASVLVDVPVLLLGCYTRGLRLKSVIYMHCSGTVGSAVSSHLSSSHICHHTSPSMSVAITVNSLHSVSMYPLKYSAQKTVFISALLPQVKTQVQSAIPGGAVCTLS